MCRPGNYVANDISETLSTINKDIYSFVTFRQHNCEQGLCHLRSDHCTWGGEHTVQYTDDVIES